MQTILEILGALLMSNLVYFLLQGRIRQWHYRMLLLFASTALGVLTLSLIDKVTIVSLFITTLLASFAFTETRKTLNLYRLIPLIVTIHSPLMAMIDHKASYFLALLLSMVAFFLLGGFLQRHYGSANMGALHSLVTTTPKFAFFLRLNLLNSALFPPFATAIITLVALTKETINIWVLTALMITFIMMMLIAMRINAKTLYGKKNISIDYHDLEPKEIWVQAAIILAILLMSALSFMEVV